MSTTSRFGDQTSLEIDVPDADSPEWMREDFARAKPARDVLPPAMFKALVERSRGQRGPQKAPTKIAVTLRLDRDVVERFRAHGPGWQTRINEALRKVKR